MVQAEIRGSLEWAAVESLIHHPDNPNQGDVGAITESIRANGFVDPLIVQQSTRYVLSGNHRLEAARALGMGTVPVVWVDCDPDRAIRIMLALNRTRDLASYDDDRLAATLTDLAQGTTDALDGTAWDGEALDALIADLSRLPDPPPPVEPTHKRGECPGRCPRCGYPDDE